MTLKEYEELYCTYCDSQRCVNVEGDSIPETCPYWETHMKMEEKKNDSVCSN